MRPPHDVYDTSQLPHRAWSALSRKPPSFQVPACHTQARSLDEVTERIREAIALCLEVEGAPEQELEFIGIQRVTIAA